VQRLGKLTLNRNPDNFFAETEQVAFHPGHVVPGIDFSNDPLLQGRLFSYIDTQIKRVGPNFAEVPINRPTCPVHNNQRDAESRHTINKERVAYFPNSLGNGCPAHSPEAVAAFSSYAEKIDGVKVRQRSPSFGDHFSQATLFWNSMSAWEKKHIIEAFSFELNMVETQAVRDRVVNGLLANVAEELAQGVSEKTGVELTGGGKPAQDVKPSPALSMDKPADSIKGRKVAILAVEGVDDGHVSSIKALLQSEGALTEVIAQSRGSIKTSGGRELRVDRAAPNAPSVAYDAVFVPGGKAIRSLLKIGIAVHFVAEAYAHAKPVAAIGEGVDVLRQAMVPLDPNSRESDVFSAEGVVTASSDVAKLGEALVDAMKKHRFFDRKVEAVPA
jgi:catalase